ncbi:MAG: hypothetical protein JWM68_3768 [Verrucomicrobiales bacterium]|nr:hypothetical protein [Verrucomicrobiales bacterium]
MCDFHSTAWRLLGQEIQMAHDPNNSHSDMIDKAGWRVNQPHRPIVIFEAEWSGDGDVPSNGSLIRNSGECPEKLVAAIRRHYEKLKEAISEGKHLGTYFQEFEKYSDVWARVKALPEGVTFPAKCDYLDLSSLTSLPEGVTFPAKCDYLDLRSLTSLPEGVTLPADLKTLDLRSLTSLPEGVTFPADLKTLDLRSDLKAQLRNRK